MKAIFLYTTLACIMHAGAQSVYPPLKVGDRMPDYKLVNLINYKSTTAAISDFSGKMLILDFWSTYCISCIQSWPKLLKIQDEYKDSVQIILVNSHQDETIVRNAFAKREKSAGITMNLPAVCGDTVLSNMFPRLGVPHVIWIDREGVIRSVTNGIPLVSKNVGEMLRNPQFRLPQAWTTVSKLPDTNKPLFVNENGGNGEALMYYSMISGYMERMPYSIGIGPYAKGMKQFNRITAINVPLIDLYGFAYSIRRTPYHSIYTMTRNRLVFEGFDSTEYADYIDGIQQFQHFYTYQLILPELSADVELQEKMREDLYRFFRYEVKWENRKVKCRVFRVDDSTRISNSLQEQPKGIIGIGPDFFRVHGENSFRQIIWDLENLNSKSRIPILNEAGMKGNPWGVQIETDIGDFNKLDAALRPYGMSLKPEEREIPMLIIRKTH